MVASIISCNNKKEEILTKNYPSQLLSKSNIIAPTADTSTYLMEKHGDIRNDLYYWMKLSDAQKNAEIKDDQTKKVIAYLDAENKYREEMMSHLKPTQDSLFEEIKGRIKQTDESVPYKDRGYWYITRFEEGKEYAIRSRKKETLDAKEEILLDENDLAKPHKYFATSGFTISPDNNMMAYGEDVVSRRQYTIRFKDLRTGQYLADEIKNTSGNVIWANDNKTIFYSVNDASLRVYKIFKHTLGTPVTKDVEVFHEKDETFGCYVTRTRSDKYIVIGSYSTLSNEYSYLSADDPNGKFTLFQPRERDLEHSIDHYDGKWYIRTNKDGAKNFKLMTCEEVKTSKDTWKDHRAHDPKVLFEGFELFKNHLVLSERVDGITKIKVQPWGKEGKFINFGEDSYVAYISANPDPNTETLRLAYTSLTTPSTVYDCDMNSLKLEIKKEQEVLGGFNKNDYTSERILVPAKDGTKIPVSIVYKKGFKKDGSQPLLLYGYGSYGASMDPSFSAARLTLLNRGFTYAIAHIRGGEEMGRQWYEDGKLLKKKNTFTDFIDCGQYLVDNKYTSKDKHFAMGGSAGGLLIGAVVNMRPDLWKGVICAVPFVDVVTTMLDESIPLTTGEYDEWGNPNDKTYYEYMKSYSPYDNIEKKDYPAMLVTTGFHDSQVQYWEPAKYVAKLRAQKTDKNPLLMYCNMSVGHGGASGRFERFKEVAMEYAFILDLAGQIPNE
jgi:oligopeptidase B